MNLRSLASVSALTLAAALLASTGAGAQNYDYGYGSEPVRTHHHHHHYMSHESRYGKDGQESRYERARYEGNGSRDEGMTDQRFRRAPGSAYQIPLNELDNPKS